MRSHPLIIAIAGGSGSGKTFLAHKLAESFLPRRSRIITQDSYYKSLPTEWINRPADYNFDHPDALDWDLLIEQLNQLKHGREAAVPLYCFITHMRIGSEEVPPAEILIYEGTMILHDLRLCAQANLKIFLDVPADVRVLRRLERDVKERGRTIESVIHQYRATVRPMHLEFVEFSQYRAAMVLADGPVEEWVAQVIRSLPEKWHRGDTSGFIRVGR